MKKLLAYCCTVLLACAPTIDLKNGKVTGGVMSKTQAWAGKIAMADGSKATWSMVNNDSTEVPIEALEVAKTVAVAGFGAASIKSTNNANTAKVNANTKGTTVVDKAADGSTTTKVLFPPQQP